MFRNVKFRNILIIYWTRVLTWFGYWKSTEPIPLGVYCYKPDNEKNTKTNDFMTKGIYYTIPCKYYKIISKKRRGCSYLGFITDDPVFLDQCKECGENYGD